MSYFNKLNKFGEMVKVLKLYIVALTVSIVADYLDIPSKVVCKYGIIPFSVILVCVCTFVIIYILQNHIFNSFKNKNINEIDSLILFNIIFDVIYLIFISVTFTHNLYKVIILSILLIVSLVLFVYRLWVYKKINIKKSQNINVYDLKDFIESNDIIKVNDFPILFAEKDVDYDLFNRDIIINKLYSSVQACKGANFSFVIGLEGPWGSGKTTVVNNVISKIRENSPNDFIVINDFDPWTYNNQESLLICLFDKVLKSTGINYSNSSLKSIVNTLFESIKNSNPLGNIVGNIFLRNESDDDIENLKDQICDYLEQNDKTIIIFIDNLDRASSENIVFLLKVINNIFDLKRVLYVLSYDKQRINALLDNSNINEKFVEKIIQQEISITKLNKEKMHTVVRDCVTKLFVVYGIQKGNYNEFSYIIEYLSNKISDIREFKRILNSVAPILSVKNELYKPDLFALEIIRFINNDFYEEIYNNAKYFVSVDFEANIEFLKISFRKKEFNKEGKEYFEKLENNYGRELLNFAANIFPNVKKYLNNVDLRSEYESRDENKNVSLNCGVASAKYFDLYFHLGENEYLLITKVYNNFINLINNQSISADPDDIVKSFDEFFNLVHKDYHEEIINKLWLARNDFSTNLNYPILIGLINNSEKISRESGFLALSPYQRACAIMATLYSLIKEEEKSLVVACLKKDIKFLNLCSQIMYWLNSSSLYYSEKESDVASFATLITDMYNSIITTPIDIYCDKNYGVHNSWALLRTKRKVLDLDKDADVDIVDYISSIMKPKYIYRVLIDTISTSNGTQGYGYSITEKSLKSFFANDDIVLGYLNECPPSNDLETFIHDVFYKYKYGEPDDLGEKVIYTENYINLF